MRLEYIRSENLPRLAWCAVLAENNETVVVHHGPWIEVNKSAFVEGAWSGPYVDMGFPNALTFTGSGAAVAPEGILFAAPTHSIEPLYVLRAGQQLYCSNSLRHVLVCADDDIDPGYMFYDVDIVSMEYGTKHCTSRLPTWKRNWVSRHHYCNLHIDKTLMLTILPKTKRGTFLDYSDYRTFLDEQVLLTVINSRDPQRSVQYTPLSTISKGYDSTAVSVIARNAGCREYITFHTAADESNDSGKEIGQLLGLAVTEYDRDAYRTRNDLPEAEFAATGGSGGSVIMAAWEQCLRGKILLSGTYGDEAWERAKIEGGVDMMTDDSAGADIFYFRTRVGFFHLAVPSIGYSEFTSILKIANSVEMRPWRLERNKYDRPIPRRIVEEAGVPRECFGQQKKWTSRSLRFCNPNRVDEPDLQEAMAPTSYAHFSQWKKPIPLYSSQLDRWFFALMYKLYWLNMRIIRSNKVRAVAQRLRIPVPPRPLVPMRFKKQRVQQRLLIHWGMEQIKSQYAAIAPIARAAT